MNLEVVSDDRDHPLEASVKVKSRTLSRLFLESWRTWRFLMKLEVVLDDREHPLEASVKFSSRFKIRNPVKTPPVLHVSS